MIRRSVAGALFVFLGLLVPAVVRTAEAGAIPDEFNDPETGARIVHVSRVPNDRSGVIYFTQNSVTSDSRRVLFHVQFEEKWRHLYTFDLQTHEVVPIVTDRLTTNQDFSAKSNNVYYLADHAIWSANIDTRLTKKLADLPLDWSTGAGVSCNADETLVVGATEVGFPDATPSTAPARSGAAPETARLQSMAGTFAAHRPNLLYTINLKTGELRIIHRVNTWLGHVQFSPTDPNLIMFCHEGPWEKVDRIWTVQADGSNPAIFFHRSEPNEIAGHEFWADDGKTIWFQHTFRDLKKGYLSGKGVLDGKLTEYLIPPEGGAIHQTIAPDGKFFIGDGSAGRGGNNSTKYLTLQVPDGDTLKVTRLCSLQKNDYTQCEPNPHISPDQHWAIFTATFTGVSQAYAVEMPKQFWR